jgi:cell division protein FtsQ
MARDVEAGLGGMWDKPRLLVWVANMLYALAAILMVYAVLFLLVHLPVFPLREIKVNGELKHVTREQVQLIVRRELRGNFFTLDLDQARKGFEKLPWVRQVSVRRRWPDHLDVALEEHVALARWGGTALVNSHGELFHAASNAELPMFVGPVGMEKEVTERYETFRQLLAPLKFEPRQVVLSPRRAWQLRLNNGLTVELGREQTDARLAKFVSVYERTVGRLGQPVQYVDLRYPNGFAVRFPEFKRSNEVVPREARKAA